jgi:hypothetical protein
VLPVVAACSAAIFFPRSESSESETATASNFSERSALQLLARRRRRCQVRPVTVEVFDHVHHAVLELTAELRAHDVRLHRGVGRPGLPSRLEARSALLFAEIGLVSRPVDVKIMVFSFRLRQETGSPDS